MPIAALDRYWRLSRTPRYSVLFAFPLLVLYETLAALLPRTATRGVRNGADVLLKSAFASAFGPSGPIVFGVVLLAACVYIVRRDMRSSGGQLQGAIFAGMLGESILLAMAFGVIVGVITARLLGAFGALAIAPVERLSWATRIMVSLGAGLYEELLFRVLLVGVLGALATRVFGWRPRVSVAFSVITAALIFSAFHYIGPYGDTLHLQSFVFRWIAGLGFSLLYVWRGFGIDAWTHALYDILLLAT